MISLLDYGAGNVRSLRNAIQALGFSLTEIERPEDIKEIPGAGKGSHRKLVHSKYPGAVTVSGKAGEDAKRYQEKEVAHPPPRVRPMSEVA